MIIGIDGNEANVGSRVGVNQYAYELLRALYKLPEARHHEFVIYLSKNPLADLPKSRDGWQYKILPAESLWVIRKLTPHLWFGGDRPDVLFIPSHYAPPISPVPIVLAVMDLGYRISKNQLKKRDFYQLKYWGGLSIRQAKKIIAISESTKQEITKYYPGSKDKIVVAYPGYDKEKYKKQKAKNITKVKEKYRISGEYILYLGTLKPSKNVEGLIEAFKLLVTSHQSLVTISLVIVGKRGWLYESIFEKIKELDLEDKIVFTDFVPEEDKVALLSGSKALVSPSFWEGFGMHVLEAMALGVPPVISGIGSLPEVVGEAGFIVDPESPEDIARGIKEVVSLSKQAYNKASKKAVAQAEKFGWEKTAKNVLQALLEAGK